jgi:hypothetical protein
MKVNRLNLTAWPSLRVLYGYAELLVKLGMRVGLPL